MLELISNESKPCSGGGPTLTHKQWAVKGHADLTVHLSHYSGRDVRALSSVYVVDKGPSAGPKTTTIKLPDACEESEPFEYQVERLVCVQLDL